MNRSHRQSRDLPWGYLSRETVLVLLLSYILLLGGGPTGLVVTPVRLINTALLALVGLVWLATRLLKRHPFPATPLDTALLVFLVAHAITSAMSIDPRRSAIQLWMLGAYVVVFYLIVDLLRHGWPAELMVKSLLIASAVVLLFGGLEIAQWYRSWHAIWGWARPFPAVTLRVSAGMAHPNVLAAVLNLLWPLALSRLWSTRQRLPRCFLALWLAAAGVLLYFTSSRGGWLGTVGALLTVGILSHDLRRFAQRLIWWLAARRWRVVVAIALVVVTGALGVTLLTYQVAHPSHIGGFDARLYFWRPAWVAFRSSPLFGTGPFTYGEAFLRAHSVPPARLFRAAHSYPINLAAESGLLGLVGLVWIAVALARHGWMIRRGISADGRPLYVGAIAALVGFAVHSQFDSVVAVPYISILLAVNLALLLAPDPAPAPSGRKSLLSGAGRWLLPLGWTALLVTAFWSLAASAPYSRGLAAADAGEWEEAAARFDEAQRRDPGFAYYQLQAGYAHGRLAVSGDAAHLDTAIAHYHDGTSRSPHYALNAAHLGALYRQAGDMDQALAWAERAVDLAPRSALFTLNLGRLHEELGHPESASEQYERALTQAPEWAQAAYWRATPLRQSLIDDWLAARSSAAPPKAPRSTPEWIALGDAEYETGRAAEALAAFERALEQDPHSVRAYVGQAQVYLSLGRAREAEQVLRTALSTVISLELDHARALTHLAQIYRERGELQTAIEVLESGIGLGQRTLSQEPRVLGWRSYPHTLFYRESPNEHLLPQLAVITVTDEVAEWMLQLGRWHEEAGDTAAAAELYRELLEEVPDCEAARHRLTELDD